MTLYAVSTMAQNYFVYGEMRNKEESEIANGMKKIDTVFSKEQMEIVLHQSMDILSVETDYRKTIGSLSNIFYFAQMLNDTAACEKVLSTIDSLGSANNDENARIQYYILQANRQHTRNDHHSELEMLIKAELIAEKTNNIAAMAHINVMISKRYDELKDIYNSTKCILEAISIAEKSLDPQLIADIYFEAASYFLDANDFQLSFAYISAAISYFQYIGNYERIGQSYITMGYLYLNFRNDVKSLEYIKKAIDLLKPTHDKIWLARAYNCAGYIGSRTGKMDFAQKNYRKSLELRQSISYETEIAEASASYGEFFIANKSDKDSSIKYLKQGLIFAEKYQQTSQITRICNNLAHVYAAAGMYDSAYHYALHIINIKGKERFNLDPGTVRATQEYFSDIDKSKATERIRSRSNATIERQGNEIMWLNIGITLIVILLTATIVVLTNRTKQNKRLLEQKRLIQEKSLELQIKNMELERTSLIARHTNNGIAIVSSMYVIEWLNQGIVTQLNAKGTVESYLHQPARNVIGDELIKHFELCFKIGSGVSFEIKRDNNKFFQVTLTPYTNQVGRKQIIVITTDITEQKAVEEEIEKKKRELEMQTDMMAVINSELAAQKAAISEQNEQLELKNREITESLEYARKIQDAIQPMQVFLDAVLKEYFVINFPRDIVSGDFHWFDYRDGNTYIALADCTGHGIPGAVMSMLGTVTLSNIISSRNTNNAAEVLDQLRSKIIKMLHQRGIFGEAQDGMDISLCVYNEEKQTLHYAGAYSYTYLARFGTPDEETIAAVEKSESRIIKSGDGSSYLICFKPDRMPIGIHTKDNIPFRDVELHVTPNDILYMTSDGFSDQFGGEKNKKFYSANFEKLLLSVTSFDIQTQKEMISKAFIDWKGINEQVDDVHIIGVKL